MNVCIDAQAATQRGGIGRYVRCLAEALVRLDGNDTYTPFRFDLPFRASPYSDRVSERVHRYFPEWAARVGWRTISFPPFDWFAPTADVYHFPNYLHPPLHRGRSVVTVHDASFARVPETMEAKNLRYLRRHLEDSLHRADAIITVSEFTANEIRELFPAVTSKLHPIPLALPPELDRAAPAAILSLRERLELQRPYLLTVGTLEPRKNHELLIEAFEHLDREDVDLVLAGALGWKCEPILDRMRRSSRASRIRHLDWVPEADLPALYSGAELFLFSSRYEGFGFPPLEAMRCGTPVLAARRASLPEVLGEAALWLDTERAVDWANAIRECLENAGQRESLSKLGRQRSFEFTWEQTASRTRDVYRQINAS